MADNTSNTARMPGLIKRDKGAKNVGLGEVPRPVPGPDEVVIEVYATGICGTDLHIRDDEFPSIPPVVMGHEVTGRVVEAGSGAEDWMGKRVSPETYFYTCDRCEACLAGRRNLCPTRKSIGSHVNGGFATYVKVPQRNLHEVHASVGEHAGALYEPLSCVAQCLCDPAVASPGDTALVVGPGAMGILCAQVLKSQGAQVTISGTPADAQRLDIAATLGLTPVLAADLEDAVPGVGFDVVADASGNERGIDAGLRAIRKGGHYVQVGLDRQAHQPRHRPGLPQGARGHLGLRQHAALVASRRASSSPPVRSCSTRSSPTSRRSRRGRRRSRAPARPTGSS